MTADRTSTNPDINITRPATAQTASRTPTPVAGRPATEPEPPPEPGALTRFFLTVTSADNACAALLGPFPRAESV